MKIVSIIVLFLAAFNALYASEMEVIRLHVEVDSGFNKEYGAAWWLNRGVSAKDAKATIVKEENGKCLKIEVPEGQRNASVVSETKILFIADGTLEMRAKLKGQGTFAFNFYCYDDKGKYLGGHGTNKNSAVDTADWQQFTDSIAMSRFPKETCIVRAVLCSIGSGTIYVDDAVYSVIRPRGVAKRGGNRLNFGEFRGIFRGQIAVKPPRMHQNAMVCLLGIYIHGGKKVSNLGHFCTFLF